MLIKAAPQFSSHSRRAWARACGSLCDVEVVYGVRERVTCVRMWYERGLCRSPTAMSHVMSFRFASALLRAGGRLGLRVATAVAGAAPAGAACSKLRLCLVQQAEARREKHTRVEV